MATLDSLRADPDVMRQGNDDNPEIQGLSDADLVVLNLESAQAILKKDLKASINAYEDSTSIDTVLDQIVDKYEECLQLALMYLQLKVMYQQDYEIDSKNSHRFDTYARLYDDEKALFTNYKLSSRSNTRMVNFLRG